MRDDPTPWLLASDEPWTRYRTLVDLLGRSGEDPDVCAARAETLAHPLVRALAGSLSNWPRTPIRRHNDAAHPMHALAVLADLGLRAPDAAFAPVVEEILSHRSPEGPLRSLVNVPRAFGGSGLDAWTWLACDAPTLLHGLLALGVAPERVQGAVDHLAALAEHNGWHCRAAADLGRFHGPGRKTDPCPMANLLALRALSCLPEQRDAPAARAGVAALLDHWERRGAWRPYLFGVGSDYHKLKYPFVWYDILHVADVLSRFPCALGDPRYREMLAAIASLADDRGRFTAGSMYRAWQGWSFADKKRPSPWLTFLAWRVVHAVTG